MVSWTPVAQETPARALGCEGGWTPIPKRHTPRSLRPDRGGLKPEPSHPENRGLFEKVEILFLLAAVVGCVVTLLHVALVVPLPYEVNFGEGPLLGIGVRVAQGLSAYPPATQLPYVISPYGPLPYYLAGWCVKHFGVSFSAPRLLVVASGIWCAAMIALLLRHWAGRGSPAWDSASSTCHDRWLRAGYPSFA